MAQSFLNSNSQEEDISITLRDILSILFKHKSIIVTTFLVVATLVNLGLLYLPSVYSAHGRILVKTERQGNPTFFSGVASYEEKRQSDPVNRKMETEMELVESRPIAEGVVKELDIVYSQVYHKPYVHFLDPVGAVVDFVFEILGFPLDPLSKGFDDTVSELVKSISVSPVKSKSSETTSNIMQLSIRTHDKQLASEALLKIMESYQKHNTEMNRKAGEKAYNIIKMRKDEAYATVLANQQEHETFIANTRNAPELINAKNVRHSSTTSPGDVASIAMLRKQVIKKDLELDAMRHKYSPNHLPYKQLLKSINSLKYRITVETKKYAANDSQLRSLARKLETSETVYLELKKKLAQINIYLDMNDSQTESRIIVEPPLAPRNSSWKKDVLMGVLGSFAGLVLGIGFAGYREYADHRLESIHEVQRYFGFEVLGIISDVSESDLRDVRETLNGKKKFSDSRSGKR